MASKRVSSGSGIVTAWQPSFSLVRGPFSQLTYHHRITDSVDPGSALDPVVQVGDAGLPLEDPGALQLDVLGTALVEQPAPLAQQHRDEVELELVEDPGSERELRGCGAVDQHVLAARSLLRPGDRGLDVGHVGDQWPLSDVDARLPPAEDEDRHAVVVDTAPAARGLEGPPAGDDRPGGHELVDDLAVHTRRAAWDS